MRSHNCLAKKEIGEWGTALQATAREDIYAQHSTARSVPGAVPSILVDAVTGPHRQRDGGRLVKTHGRERSQASSYSLLLSWLCSRVSFLVLLSQSL